MKIFLAFLFSCYSLFAAAQDINNVLQKAKAKMETVNSYEATGIMKTNVAFLKVPIANVKVYFKKPGKLKIKSERGISFVPKGAVSINMSNIIGTGKFTVIDAGTDKINGIPVRIAKLLPDDDNSDIVLSTISLLSSSGSNFEIRNCTPFILSVPASITVNFPVPIILLILMLTAPLGTNEIPLSLLIFSLPGFLK